MCVCLLYWCFSDLSLLCNGLICHMTLAKIRQMKEVCFAGTYHRFISDDIRDHSMDSYAVLLMREQPCNIMCVIMFCFFHFRQ